MWHLLWKHNAAADFLSRYPRVKANPDELDKEQDDFAAAAMVAAIVATLDLSGCTTIDEGLVLRAALKDPSYQLLIAKVTNGDWSLHRSQEFVCLRPFYNVRDRLAMSGDLVTYTFGQGCVQLVIPESLRYQIATNLHANHQGLHSVLRKARQSVYWPGIGDLRHHWAICDSCNTNAPSQCHPRIFVLPNSAQSPCQPPRT